MSRENEYYNRLLETTTEILDAAQDSDIERLSRAVKARQVYVDKLPAMRKKELTPEQRAKLNEIIILDKKAGILVRKLYERQKKETTSTKEKIDGMIKYNKSRMEINSVHMFDKKR